MLMAGLLIGAVAATAYLRLQQSNNQARFEAKITCRQIAQEYEKNRSRDGSAIELQQVDYSPKRNSCIATLDSNDDLFQSANVVDVITGEVIWSDECVEQNTGSAGSDWCGNGRNVKMDQERDKQFLSILTSRGSY
jgi:hypothetical protein